MQGPQCAEDGLHHQRRETERGLVQHHHLGVGQQRPADRQHLLLAPRQRAGELPQPLAQPWEQADDEVEPLGPPGKGPAIDAAQQQIVAHRHLRKHQPAFRHLRDAELDDLVRRHVGKVLAVEFQRAAGGPDQPADAVNERALAGVVGAEQGHHLALLDLQRHAIENLPAAVSGGQGRDLKHRVPRRNRRRAQLGWPRSRPACPPRPSRRS